PHLRTQSAQTVGAGALTRGTANRVQEVLARLLRRGSQKVTTSCEDALLSISSRINAESRQFCTAARMCRCARDIADTRFEAEPFFATEEDQLSNIAARVHREAEHYDGSKLRRVSY